jgi:hypothetical protein
MACRLLPAVGCRGSWWAGADGHTRGTWTRGPSSSEPAWVEEDSSDRGMVELESVRGLAAALTLGMREAGASVLAPKRWHAAVAVH